MVKPIAKAPHGVNGSLPAFNNWPNDAGVMILSSKSFSVT